MWLQRLILYAFITQLHAWDCGVTPDWEQRLATQVDEARQLQSGSAFARSPVLGPFRIYPQYMDMSALPAATVTRIKEVTMPSVLKWFANVLAVYNLSENWKLAQTACGSAGTVPTDHTTTGVASVDLVIYVFASTDAVGSWAARAGACAFEGGSSNGAPIAGTFEFNAAKYTPDMNTDVEIQLARHEISHVLALSSSLFTRYKRQDGTVYPNPTNTANVRGKTVSQLATPLVLSKAKAAFGCATLTGLELEDYGGLGTAGSHWEKRIMFNDYMTGSTISDAIYSDITLAIFEDSGWYTVDYTYTDQITFGRGKGCAFFTTKCVTAGTANFPEFCANTAKACANLNTKKGYCNLSTYTTALPTAVQYFTNTLQGGSDSLADFCPYVSPYSNGDCTGWAKTTTLQDSIFGEKICSTCRCFLGTYIQSGYTLTGGDPNHTGCHDVTCANGVATVTIGTVSVACPAAGGQVSTIAGYNGFIICPPYADICGPKVCPNGCYGYGKCVSGLCVCNDGYSGADCSTICDMTCKTCSGTSSTQCLSCYASASLSSGSCICITGYNLDSITKRCIRVSYTCNVTCQTCSGPEDTKCTSCGSNAKIASNGSCACNPGFTRSADQTQCVPCFSTCTTCLGTAANNCTGCKMNASLPSGQTMGACSCAMGFFARSDSTCAACHTTCQACTSELVTSCTSCKTADATVTAGVCLCPNRFFLSADGSQCTACDPSCLTCIGPSASQCKSCYSQALLVPAGGPGVCGCPAGLYASLTSAGCLPCHFSCKTCAGSASTQCTSCANGGPNAEGQCVCTGGKFMSAQGVCTACSLNCKECTDVATTCIACDAMVAVLSADSCVCLATAYKNQTTEKCMPCPVTCLACNGSSDASCLSCGDNASLASGACVCDPGFTRSPDSKQCVACHPSCATCSGPTAADCISCKVNAIVSASRCSCDTGFFAGPNFACEACNPYCASCSGPKANNCVTCKAATASLAAGMCVCAVQEYLAEDGSACLQCDASCKACAVAGPDSCLSCYPLGVLHPAPGPGTCSCAAGLIYVPPDGCLGCDASCKQCAGVLASQCTSCFLGAALSAAAPSSCKCTDGYIASETAGGCVACNPNCEKCTGKPVNCTSCDTTVSQLVVDTCQCLSSAFKSQSGACVACHPLCVTCSSPSSDGCLTCASNAVLYSRPGSCRCVSSFYPNPDVVTCAACHSSCKECSGPANTQCSTCVSPAILAASGACVCLTVGFYPSPDATSCKACDSTCKSCVGATAEMCTDCFLQATLAGAAPSACVCVAGTVARPTSASCSLLTCDPTCASCSSISLNQCTSCFLNAIGLSSPFPSACICAVGFYPSPDSSNCVGCDMLCVRCSGPTRFACLSCPSGKVLVDNMFCEDACPTGQTATSGVCLVSAVSAVFRLKLDQISPVLNDTIAGGKVQLGNSPGSDTSDPTAFYQQGYFFDGVDDYILLPPTNAETARYVVLGSTHSMEFWIRPSTSAATGCLISKYKTVNQALSLLLKFCVTETGQLRLEFSGVSLTDASVTVTKAMNGGQVASGRAWTSVGYQLVLKSKASTIASIFLSQQSISTETYPGFIFLDFIGTSGSVKFIVGASLSSSQSFSNFFKGNIAEVSIYNGELKSAASICGCGTCTTGNMCLNQCFSNEYSTSSTCVLCLSTCTSGCIRGSDCRTNVDPLCSSFTSFLGCSQCSDLAEMTTTGCQCTANANFLATRGACACSDGYQKSGNKCVQCMVYFDTNMVSAYFDSTFMKIIVDFTKPVVTRAVSNCAQLFLTDTLAKLGSNPSCVWATTSQSVTVMLGTNSTIINEKLLLNYVSLYSSQGTCSFIAVPLEPMATYKFPLPTVVTKLIAPQMFSVTCSKSDFLQLDASGTIGGKGRDLNFTWTVTSDPLLSSLSQYQAFKTTNPMLSIPKGLLNTSTLTVKVTARNFYSSENTATITISVTSGAAISLEIDGGDNITALASTRNSVKVNPKAICSKTSSLVYSWSFVEASPPQTDVSFPFLSSPSPPNTITIPASILKPGYTYIFIVKASDGKSSGSASFKITVPKSPLFVDLDRTSCDISVSNPFQISGDRSKDPDGLDGILAYSWTCLDGTSPCSDPTGTAVINGEVKSTLTIPANKLKENSTWNITLTVSKDTRKASKSVTVSIKGKTAVDFTQLAGLPLRVNPQANVKIVLGVSSALQTIFSWSQIFGNGLSLLTPMTYPYLLIGSGSMQPGATYGFSLTATNTNGQSSAQVFFTANYPPSGGTATITPTSGTALRTIFQEVCSSWEDAEQDYPLSYSLTYTYRNFEVAVGTKTLSNIRLIKAGLGTYQLTAYVYDTIGSVSTVKLPIITAAMPGRMLQSTDVLNAFLEDTVDTDRTYEMVIAYSSVYEFTNSTYAGIFSALQTYVSQVVVVDMTDLDSCISCLEAFFAQKKQMNSATLKSLLDFITTIMSRYQSALTETQTAYLTAVLGRYPGTSDDERALLKAFLSKLMQTSSTDNLPDQTASSFSSDTMNSYSRRVSSGTLGGLKYSSGNTAVTFPTDLMSSLGLTANDVLDVRTDTAKYANNTSDQVEISLYSSGRFVGYAFEPSNNQTEVIVKNLTTPISFSLPVNNYKPNVTYACSYKDSAGKWSSDGLNLTSLSSTVVTCSSTHLSTFQLLELYMTPTSPLPPSSPTEATTISIISSSCSPNFAPIAIVSGVALFGLLLTLVLLIIERKKSRGIKDVHLPQTDRMSTAREISGLEKVNEKSLMSIHISVITENSIPESLTLPTVSWFRLFLESHCVLGLCVTSPILPKWWKVLTLTTALSMEMAVVGSRYERSSGSDSNSQAEIWLQYDAQDFVYALVGLAVGLGASAVLVGLSGIAGKVGKCEKAVLGAGAGLAVGVICAATAGSIYMDLDLCFEAGGRWAVNFLVLLGGEVFVCQSLLSAIRATALKIAN